MTSIECFSVGFMYWEANLKTTFLITCMVFQKTISTVWPVAVLSVCDIKSHTVSEKGGYKGRFRFRLLDPMYCIFSESL